MTFHLVHGHHSARPCPADPEDRSLHLCHALPASHRLLGHLVDLEYFLLFLLERLEDREYVTFLSMNALRPLRTNDAFTVLSWLSGIALWSFVSCNRYTIVTRLSLSPLRPARPHDRFTGPSINAGTTWFSLCSSLANNRIALLPGDSLRTLGPRAPAIGVASSLGCWVTTGGATGIHSSPFEIHNVLVPVS